MDKKIRTALVLGMTSLMSLPAYARGFGGFHGGGGFGRGGGFDHNFDRSFGDGGFGGHESHPNFGGGFNGAAGGDKPVVSNHPNYGVGSGDHGINQPDHANFPTDGGFGNASHDRVPSAWDNGNGLHAQGDNVRGNFNGDTFNHNNFNRDVNVNNIGNGYHNYGYHPYNGYHAYGYHGYSYHGYYSGYNPTAAMWTFAGVTSLTMLSTFLGIAVISDLTGGKKKNNNNNSTTAAAAPVTYSNVTYNNGNVYVDGQASGSAADFYQQAQKLAGSGYTSTTGTGTDNKDAWKNLGTFSLTPKGSDQSDMMVQLEVNAQGVIHGTYYNQLTMETQPVYGAVDKQSQRVSWTLGTNNSTVFDAGLADLTKDESTVLVHYGADNTQRMALIRLKKAPPGVTEPSQSQSQT